MKPMAFWCMVWLIGWMFTLGAATALYGVEFAQRSSVGVFLFWPLFLGAMAAGR